ncbi:MAG: hypothetical protein U1C19_08220 [Methanobacteriaceae archaeon]|nr:hypothetical protein [Methanobacteriaceae archaeon]
MGLLDRINYKGMLLKNAEPNAIEEVGIGFDDNNSSDSVDLIDKVPFIVNRTISNCRFAANDPTVKGILTDIISKTNSTFVIEGDDQKSTDYIIDRCGGDDWDISQLMDDMLWAGMVDGECFIEKIIVDNKIQIRSLAFDAENYRIKKIYDKFGKIEGYKQLTQRNKNTNTGWLKKRFDELLENLEEITTPYQPGEIINPRFLQRNGKGRSIVMDILDPVYYKRILGAMMPSTVFKNSNVMVVTMGNQDVKNKRLTRKARDNVARETSNYHKKGVVLLPYGISAEMVGNNQLPDIPYYIKSYKSEIYEGLITPEALYSSESSNRSTAEVQMEGEKSGRVLFLESNQDWLKKYIEKELFEPDLELAGLKGKVWINFNPDQEDKESAYMEEEGDKGVSKSESEEDNDTATNDVNETGDSEE